MLLQNGRCDASMQSHLNLRLICVYGACIHKIINKQIIVSFTRWEKKCNLTHTEVPAMGPVYDNECNVKISGC